VSAGPPIAFSTLAFPDASVATAVATRGGYRSSGRSGAPKEIEEPEVALPQHLRLLESWLRDPQEAV
jgi:hypothetical protein